MEYSFWLSPETLLLVSWDDEERKLWRTVDGRQGYYRTASYRDHEIVTFPVLPDGEVSFEPLVGSAPGSESAARYGDLLLAWARRPW